MNQGIEILLARMDTNPDEFVKNSHGLHGRWTSDIQLVFNNTDAFTDEERQAVYSKLQQLERDMFTNRVMKKLLTEPEEPEVLYIGSTAPLAKRNPKVQQ